MGVTPWVGQTLLAPAVSAFRKALPHVGLEFVDGFAALTYPRLRDGSLDLMIGRIAPAALLQGRQAEPLFRYEMTVVGRAQHPLAKARSLSELLETDWILSHSPHENESVMQDLFGKHGLAPPHARIQLAVPRAGAPGGGEHRPGMEAFLLHPGLVARRRLALDSSCPAFAVPAAQAPTQRGSRG